MKQSRTSFRFARALIAALFLSLGLAQASAMVDPAPMHLPAPTPEDGGIACTPPH